MKIDASIKSPTSSGVKETAPRASKSGAGAPTAAPKGKQSSQDSVQITALSSQLQAMDSVPVVDSARVDAIKLAISEGRFKINPEVIADSLLATVKDLMKNPKG